MSSTNQKVPTARTPAKRRDLIVLAVLFGLVLVGLFGLAAVTGWEETKQQLLRLGPIQILALLLLSLINYFLRALRWHLFANKLKLGTTLLQSLRHFIGGFAMGVTPGRVGEFVRMRWIRRETGCPVERSAPLVIVDRASDLAAMALIMGLGVLFSASAIPGAIPVTILALGVAILATRPRLLMTFVTLAHRIIGRWDRLFARLRGAARSLRLFSDPRVLLLALLLGAIGWAAEGFAFHFLLVWLGANVGVPTAMAIFIFSALAGGLTGAPGGVGGAEAAMVALLTLEGVPLETSIPATAIIRITTLWFAIGIGFMIFPVAERYSLKVQNALED